MKLLELKLKILVGDATGRMVETSNVQDNEFLSKYTISLSQSEKCRLGQVGMNDNRGYTYSYNIQNRFSRISAETANTYYEDNKRDVLDTLTPAVEEFCQSLLLEMANEILSVVPFQEMISDTVSWQCGQRQNMWNMNMLNIVTRDFF